MPVITIWMLKTSLIYITITFVSGSIILLNKAFDWSPALWGLLPVHIEAAIFGWVLQFVVGTAYWIFPRHVKGPKRGDIRVGWGVVIFLNAGIVGSALSFGNPLVLLVGRVSLLIGMVLFTRLIWGRIVSYRTA